MLWGLQMQDISASYMGAILYIIFLQRHGVLNRIVLMLQVVPGLGVQSLKDVDYCRMF